MKFFLIFFILVAKMPNQEWVYAAGPAIFLNTYAYF